MTTLINTHLEGCFRVQAPCYQDERGCFMKTFHEATFATLGLPSDPWREQYVTVSHQGVLRGMHFQTPPFDHHKLVYCLSGNVLDVVLDLRRSSATWGQWVALTLEQGEGVWIPKGMAHGFLTLSNEAIMAYHVTTSYEPSHDKGIRWDSFGMDWGIDNPVISTRDQQHPKWLDYSSPFI